MPRSRFVTAALLGFTVLLAACGAGTTQQAAGQPILIGTIQPMTGPYAAFGVKFFQAYNMAIDEVNAAGGINGRPLKVQFEDSQDKQDLAQTAARKLASNKDVMAIIGGRLSGAGLAIAQIAEQEKIPYLVDHPSADAITKASPPFDWTYRLNPASSFNTVPLREFLKNTATDIKKVALLYENSAYGKGVAEPLKGWFDSNGYQVVVNELYPPLSLDYRDLLNKVKTASPDLLFLAANIPDSALIVRQAKELGVKPKMISGAGAGFSINEFLEQAGDAGNSVFSTGPWSGDPNDAKVKAFVQKFFDKFGHYPKEHEAEGYAAIYVIADALKRAKSISRADIKAALASTSLTTTFGPVKFESFDGYHNQNNGLKNGQVVLSQWQERRLVNVWPKKVAEADPVYPGKY